MGEFLKKFFAKKELRALFMGLDASGKTTLLYKLKVDFLIIQQ